MFFSFITKNLNCEIWTKNLFTFKRRDGIKAEKFYGVSPKNLIFRGVSGSRKTDTYEGKLPK